MARTTNITCDQCKKIIEVGQKYKQVDIKDLVAYNLTHTIPIVGDGVMWTGGVNYYSPGRDICLSCWPNYIDWLRIEYENG